MLQVVNTLLPIFALIGLGLILARRGFIGRDMLAELNRLLFYVSLPALIIHKLATVDRIPDGTWTVLVLFTIATLTVVGLSFPVCRLLRLPRERVGTFIQGAFRGNLAYTGLPILVFALKDAPDARISNVLAIMLFVFAPTMVVYNAISVILLVGSQPGSQGNWGVMLRKVVTNPLILASAAGTALGFLPWALPGVILDTLELTGDLALPAALICVGGGMAFVSMEGRYRSASVATALKVVVLPAIAYLLSRLVDLPADAQLVLMVLAACPTAIASYVMAKEMHGDEALASGAIVLSTLACIPTLAWVLMQAS
ncbi:MAG: AEC family transporter [Opitutales bacterium]